MTPVNSADSSSDNTSPVECEPNLAPVYLRTRSGPHGPRPLKINKKRNHIELNAHAKENVRIQTLLPSVNLTDFLLSTCIYRKVANLRRFHQRIYFKLNSYILLVVTPYCGNPFPMHL